ncbi:MAG: hypothetical protein M0R22_07595 [Dehalococcoidia bacterium]|jgi:hypothetical protein|nr:hypothetical protein [Dehalococcoidia bacterium]
MTDERCETCAHWRASWGTGRGQCAHWGYVTGMEASCGFWAEPLPFDDEPVEEE